MYIITELEKIYQRADQILVLVDKMMTIFAAYDLDKHLYVII
jgi:hypothetical protein